MKILGLTGSMAMGKSTAARQCKRLNIPVYDADAVVHALMRSGGKAVDALARAFPSSVRGDEIDRAALRALIQGDPVRLRQLESILHPLVRREQAMFLRRQRRARKRLAVLDIPLLYETGGERQCDAVMVVSAPAKIQRQRLSRRPGMTGAVIRELLARQMPDAEKRRRADFIVNTGNGRRLALRQIRRAVRVLLHRKEPAGGCEPPALRRGCRNTHVGRSCGKLYWTRKQPD